MLSYSVFVKVLASLFHPIPHFEHLIFRSIVAPGVVSQPQGAVFFRYGPVIYQYFYVCLHKFRCTRSSRIYNGDNFCERRRQEDLDSGARL